MASIRFYRDFGDCLQLRVSGERLSTRWTESEWIFRSALLSKRLVRWVQYAMGGSWPTIEPTTREACSQHKSPVSSNNVLRDFNCFAHRRCHQKLLFPSAQARCRGRQNKLRSEGRRHISKLQSTGGIRKLPGSTQVRTSSLSSILTKCWIF